MVNNARGLGRKRVLAEIRKAGRVARVDLARDTEMSQATVTTITAELIRSGLIEESKRDDVQTDLKRGRPRVDLKVRGEAHMVAGLKLSDEVLSGVLADFENTELANFQIKLKAACNSVPALAEVISELLTQLTAQVGMTPRELSALGMGVSGVVDGRRGLVYWSPSLMERNIALREALQDALGLPVFVDNDANLVAVAEQYYGRGRSLSDFLVVTVEHGVGMGIVLGNEVYRGARGCGAEFGHTKVQLDGALCRCGQRGCLEAYVADYAMLREASVGAGLPATGTKAERLQALVAAANGGNPTAKSILQRAERMFAMGLANLVNIFDPQLIVISGEQTQFDYLVASDMVSQVREAIVQVDLPPPEIVIDKWSDLKWASGAASYAIDGLTDRALSDLSEHAA